MTDIRDPEYFACHILKIRDKSKELVPLQWNRAQRDFHQNRTGRDIILKARQLGFSTYVQAEAFRRTVTGTRTTITLAHDTDTTQKLRRMAERFYENFPNVKPERKYANASLTTYPGFDSTATIATAGNKQAGRGDTYTDFHGSEVAFWPDAEKIVAGAMQGGNPDVILESTPNGAQGYFYDLCMEALDGDSIWTLHFYPWWWDDEYRIALEPDETIRYTIEEQALCDLHELKPEQIKWRRLKQKELKHLFKQEYPEDPRTCFLTSGNSYFGDTSGCYTAPLDVEYNEEHQYYAGLDFGKTDDYTVMIVIDRNTGSVVDNLRVNQQSWATMRNRIATLYKKWRCHLLLAEENSIGDVNIEKLQSDGLRVKPFNTDNRSKDDIMTNLHEALHSGKLKLQVWDVLEHEMNIFVSSQTPSGLWRLAAEEGGKDDTVIALAIAWESTRTPVGADLIAFI